MDETKVRDAVELARVARQLEEREERGALSTMLSQIQLQTTRLVQASKNLQQVDEKATKVGTRLDEISGERAVSNVSSFAVQVMRSQSAAIPSRHCLTTPSAWSISPSAIVPIACKWSSRPLSSMIFRLRATYSATLVPFSSSDILNSSSTMQASPSWRSCADIVSRH